MVLSRAWTAAWRVAGDERLVLRCPADAAALSGRQVLDATAWAAGSLAERGVGSGARVVLAARPSTDAVIAFAAIVRLGAVVVPVDPQDPSRATASAVSAARATHAVLDDPDSSPWPALTPIALGALSTRRDRPVPSGHLDQGGADDLALICLTSGTTGARKAVPMTSGQVLAGCRALIAAWEWTAADVLVSALPLTHVHGLIVAAATSLVAAGTLVVVPRFTARAVVEAVEVCGGTMLFGVPTMWWRIDQDGLAGRLRALRLPVSGSAPLAPDLALRLGEAMGQLPVERYGMTETLIITSNPVVGPRRPGSVGLPLPGMSVRVAGDGVIEVRGPTVMRGYIGRPPGDGFTADGWFRTGDIGEVAGDGYLELRSRASDMIIVGGHNVHPAGVERALASVPGVAEIAVVGAPDDEWGEAVVGCVAVDRGRDFVAVVAALEDVAARDLRPFERPRRWIEVPELPRNVLGKVVRSRLPVASLP